PAFKPDWSRDLFYSLNLLTHLSVFRTDILRQIGGFRRGFEGSQDYDLSLRFIERIDERKIRHIPRVLYHWRVIPGSVAMAAGEKPYAH
ncbi:glycosyltransferase family 2 protein, partial [Escherichia coli]|nr:glycosyltransferase family 2 protein [Escherichia coli]